MAEQFFADRSAGRPVLFFVDDETLDEIYGGGPGDGVESITESVWRRLARARHHNGYFHRIEREGRRWKLGGGEGAPPFLDLLAVCVLAATRMGTGDVAPNAYYAQLRELLRIDEAGTPRGFEESLDYLWSVYTWWLDEMLQGARGLSTVVEDEHLSHIGRPLSQTLFRGSDVRQLDDFFRWIELEPDEEIDEDVLVLYFRTWAPGRNLSPGAARMLQSERFWTTLGRILGGYARHWDGTGSSREGTRTSALRVVVRLRMPRSVSLEALQPNGYPERLAGQLGGRSVLAVAEDGVFVVQGTLDPRYLLRGGTLGDEARLTLAANEVHLLRLDAELGGWASVSSFSPGERHLVLAGPAVAGSVQQQLGHVSSSEISVQPAPGTFAGWRLIGDVMLQGSEELEGPLTDYRPTLKHRFALRGGLPLGPRMTYLSGGAPDVWLPPDQTGVTWLTIDGERVDTLATTVRLASYLDPHETAAHDIGYGGVISRRISMIRSHRTTPPTQTEPGHLLELGDDGRPSSHCMVSRTEDAGEHAVTVVGPHVRGGTVRSPDPPIMLHRHAAQAWLIGARPGETIAVSKPAEPQWMRELGLSCHLYEARADFQVQYSVERWSSGELKARQRGDRHPEEVLPEADVASWAQLLLGAQLADGDRGLWRQYQAAAELVEETVGS